MDKANIIISIIIVLCIAAAVAAYGITNSDNPIFSNLAGMGTSDDTGDGIGNNTTLGNGTGSVSTNANSENGGSTGSSSSGSSGGSSSSSGSSSSGGSSSGGSGSGGSGSGSHTRLSYSTAQSIANNAVGEPGYYAESVSYSNGYWYATIYNPNGTAVDNIAISDATGKVDRY